jgi:hypothetical protein
VVVIPRDGQQVAAITGAFWPTVLVATNTANNARLAAITGGATVPANAVS